TASPMNFSTVPPKRSRSARTRVKYGESKPRTSSGSSCSAWAVESTRSAKRTVTTFRSSPAGACGGAAGAPQEGQKSAPGGTSAPHSAQATTSAVPQATQKRALTAFSRRQEGHVLTQRG